MKKFTFKEVLMFTIVMLFFYFFLYKPYSRKINLKQNGLNAIGEITSIDFSNKVGNPYFHYQYMIEGKIYDDSRRGYSSNEQIRGRKFPVIFSTKNPKQNQMLIYPRDFERFDIPFPDSLDWVKEYDSNSVIELF